MDVLVIPIALIACVGLLSGYLRFIVDDEGNVPLPSYRLSGCLGAVCHGLYDGTRDLVARRWTGNAVSSLLVYAGLALFALLFSGVFADRGP